MKNIRPLHEVPWCPVSRRVPPPPSVAAPVWDQSPQRGIAPAWLRPAESDGLCAPGSGLPLSVASCRLTGIPHAPAARCFSELRISPLRERSTSLACPSLGGRLNCLRSGALSRRLIETFLYKSLCGRVFSGLLGKYRGVELTVSRVGVCELSQKVPVILPSVRTILPTFFATAHNNILNNPSVSHKRSSIHSPELKLCTCCILTMKLYIQKHTTKRLQQESQSTLGSFEISFK